MRCRICDADLPDGAMFCGECGSSTSATADSRRIPDPRATDTTVLDGPATPTGVASVAIGLGGADLIAPAVEVAVVAAVASAAGAEAEAGTSAGPAFTLRFSTGEVLIASGSGLVGRKPMPQPGEAFDQLVQIADRTLSVSKTHLEFGLHDGALWVADRFSGNGTIVRRPDGVVVRCEPGRRYLVPRATLVQLAEQSFTVE